MIHKEKLLNKAKDVISDIKNTPIVDAVETIGARASRAGKDVYYGGRSILQRMANEHGYSRDELWNLGDNETDRIAKYMRRVADMPYEDVDMEYFECLMPYADDIGNRIDDIETLHDMALIMPFKKDMNGNDDSSSSARFKEIDSVVKERDERFMNAWRWVGRNMMTESYVRPTHKSRDSAALSKLINAMHGLVDKATDNVDAIDTDKFPVNECLRIADMLHEFVSYNIGYEDGYLSSDHQLKERDAEWADKSAGFWYVLTCSKNKSINDDAFTDAGDGMHKVKSNCEIGLDYCAYCEDIEYASMVFEAWGSWMLKHPVGVTMSESLDKVGDKLRDEFIRCWDWFGENSMSLWW